MRRTTPISQRSLIDSDRIGNADRKAVANLCVLLFDRLQLHPKAEEQLLALAGAFRIICDALQVTPQDAFTAIGNMMTDRTHPDRLEHRFAALVDHVQNYLGFKPVVHYG